MPQRYSTTNRRYLRISEYICLEVVIYLDPADTAWFNDERLKNVIALIKPLILPKLQEERTRKKNAALVKDVVRDDELEASIFLIDMHRRHAVLKRVTEFDFTKRQDGEEEDDRKPDVKISYQGTQVYDKRLCLIVKPLSKDQRDPKPSSLPEGRIDEPIKQWIENTQVNVYMADEDER